MKFLKEYAAPLLTIAFLVVVGVLLLVDPVTFAVGVVKIAGALLFLLGVVDIIKYFRTPALEAAQGQSFYSGAVLILAGCFCLFASEWFVEVFPILAVLYGLMQIMLGLRKAQYAADALRLKLPVWRLRAISAAVSLIFGFIITLHPAMTAISVWVFTGLAMIAEGIFDAVILVIGRGAKRKAKEKAAQ